MKCRVHMCTWLINHTCMICFHESLLSWVTAIGGHSFQAYTLSSESPTLRGLNLTLQELFTVHIVLLYLLLLFVFLSFCSWAGLILAFSCYCLTPFAFFWRWNRWNYNSRTNLRLFQIGLSSSYSTISIQYPSCLSRSGWVWVLECRLLPSHE